MQGLKVEDLETQRYSSFSFFPYSKNEEGEIVILLKSKANGEGIYQDFTGSFADCDPSYFYTAARCYLQQTGCLVLEKELQNVESPEVLSERLVEYSKLGDRYVIVNYKTLHEIFKNIFYNSRTIIDAVNGQHLVFFYPQAYFNPSNLNLAYAGSESYQFKDLSLHWVPLKQLCDPDFAEQRLTKQHSSILQQFSQEIINTFNPEKLKEKEDKPIEFIVMNCDERDHVVYINEAIFHGYFFDPKVKWAYYNAYDQQFPSKEVLETVKGIVLPGSRFSVYDDTVAWIKPFMQFAKSIYEDFPKIKIACICFGHQMMSEVLGGKVEKMKDRGLYLGKELISLQDSFFELPYVKYVLKDLAKEEIPRLNPLIVNCVHQDHAASIPDFVTLHGSSERTKHELWTLGDQILSMQPHPELNTFFLQEFIIDMLYSLGRINEDQKKIHEQYLHDPSTFLVRNIVMKIIHAFLNGKRLD